MTVRRTCIGIGFGVAVAAAIAAVALPLATRAMQSPSDFPVKLGSPVVPVVTALIVLVWAACRRREMRQEFAALIDTGAFLIAAGLSAVSIGRLVELYRTRAATPFMDSSGVTVLFAAVLVAAVIATLAMVVTIVAGSGHDGPATTLAVGGRITPGAFLVTAVLIPALVIGAVHSYRGRVWYPDRTVRPAVAVTAPDVPTPNGVIRYQVAVSDSRTSSQRVGTGILISRPGSTAMFDAGTGTLRWQSDNRWIPAYLDPDEVVASYRDGDDNAGIVVLPSKYGLIGVDGETGAVLWRRQFHDGERLKSMAGSIDALAVAIDTGLGRRLDSLDPATGQVRWSRPSDCAVSPGTPGQFGLACRPAPALVDARTGETIELNTPELPVAGTDAYVSSDAPRDGTPTTTVLDPAGKVLDQIPGVVAATVPYDGRLLIYDLVDRWWLRDYRRHQSIPLAFHHHADHAYHLKPTWLWDGLLLTVEKQGLLFVDRNHPSEAPTPVPNSSCSSDQPTQVYGLGKTALVYCMRTGEMIVVKPGRG
ncbi:MAG: PQQ-binding-like beta-propeller repeat protein [Mycolicibacterium insubricum]